MPPTFPLASFIVRIEGTGDNTVSTLERAMKAIDPAMFVWKVRSGETFVRDGFAQSRFAMTLLVAFAVVALVMAAVGLYGVIAYGVAQRTREIGVRIALGARPGAVAKLVVGRGLTLALGGIVLGTVASAGTTHVLGALLYGVDATDPFTFAAIALLVAVIAVVASYVPARRALRIDPTEALRAD